MVVVPDMTVVKDRFCSSVICVRHRECVTAVGAVPASVTNTAVSSCTDRSGSKARSSGGGNSCRTSRRCRRVHVVALSNCSRGNSSTRSSSVVVVGEKVVFVLVLVVVVVVVVDVVVVSSSK